MIRGKIVINLNVLSLLFITTSVFCHGLIRIVIPFSTIATFHGRSSYNNAFKSNTNEDIYCTEIQPKPISSGTAVSSTPEKNRREIISGMSKTIVLGSILNASPFVINDSNHVANAYTPDSDPLRESLYLMSRVQEATVQQQRLVSKEGIIQDDLKRKMTLSLRLVERSYRLLDQINYASKYVMPQDDIVIAVEAGNEANEALQSAIDFVYGQELGGKSDVTKEQREFLTSAMIETREKLFVFLSYMPKQKLEEARKRVEEENVANREEFDGDADAGVFNPVKLPWK